ncbi:MAG TPA: FHA domain-containing protein [Anaerolineales bacterium]|nr:FHA domain-containing protein [Anaerolineales bacterium]
MDIFEKFCPVCKQKNDLEALVCMRCGSALETYAMNETEITRTTEVQTRVVERMGELLINEALTPVGGIAMYLAGTSDPVFLSSEKEFVIGRKVEEEGTTEAFLDLAKLGGYQMGLSKRHAMIRREVNGYEVIDLSSRNGTWLNDDQLIPNKPYSLASGSQLRLARMRLFVLYRTVAGVR